jgi:hypothetical protein
MQSRTMPNKPPHTPITSPLLIGIRSTSDPTVMRIGDDVTKSKACGRLVCCRPQTQLPKCRDKHTPDAMSNHQSWRLFWRFSRDAARHW